MKKLMTMLAAVATAFGLYATDTSGTSFEGLAEGGALADKVTEITELNAPQDPADKANYWDLRKITGSATATITQFVGGDRYEGRSDEFPETPNDWYLALETTTNALTRYLAADNGTAKHQVTSSNIFFDSVVKLSAFDGEPEIADDAKVAVWLFDKSELEGGAAEAVTNLMVTIDTGAGFVNYNCGNRPALLDTWTRVTIKAMKVAEDQIGFVIYLNGNVTPVKDVDESIIYPTGLTPAAKVYAAAYQLFPLNTEKGTEISSVSFAGKGAVDDIVFTEDAPEFAKDTEFQVITWNPEAVTEIMINGVKVDESTGRYEAPIVAEQPIVIAWTGTDAYINGSKTITEPSEDTEVDLTNDIKETRAVINGVKKDTVAAAVEEANKATEQAPALLKLVKIADEEDIAVNNAYVTLDLNGLADIGVIGVEDGAAITLTNSIETVAVVEGCVWPVVAINSDKMKFNASENEDMMGGCSIIVSSFAGDWELKKNGEYYEVAPVAKKGTVIFICDKLGAPVTNEQVVGTTVALPTPTDPTQIRTFKGWFAEEALETPVTVPVTVIDGEIKIWGKAEIEIVNNEIATALDLQKLQAAVAEGNTFAGETLTQTAEITLTDWTGIGTVESKAFSGVYNGNGQTLNISYAGKSNYGGFINYLTNGAVISNLTFEASLGTEPNDSEFGFAAVAGRAVASTIADITVNGTIGTDAKPLRHNAAGVVVRADGGTIIKDCVNNASVFGAYTKMGGFVAIVNGGGTVTFENCVNNGAITAKTIDNEKTAGADGLSGILGYTQANAAIVLNNCENKGTLTGVEGSTIGTIVAKVQNGSVTATGCKAQADVASFGAIVTAGSPVTGLSFATVDAGVATFVADDALAAEGEYKVMAAGAAPVFAFTAIDQTITFKTNLFDDVDFEGITLDESIAATAKITHTEDAEGVTFKAEEVGMPDPIPPVNPGADEKTVNDAIDQAGFKDASVKAMIGGDATKYIAFKKWASETIGDETAVVNSLHAADSYQLGLEELLENDPVSEIKTVAKDGDKFTFTFEIKDGKDGDAVAATATEYVKSLVKCAEDVGFATKIDAQVNVTVVETTLTAEVTLPTGKTAAFMKVAK